VAPHARAQSTELEEDLRNLRLLDIKEGAHRFTLVVPRYLQPEQRLPLLVCLHGLGETGDERAGAYAFFERYGTGLAWQRMKRPPVERVGKRGEWTDERLAEVNAELEARPFRGFAIACPHMPMPEGPPFHDAYARWIEERLLPRVRREVPTIETPERTYLCGVSLGGYVSLEVLVRLPHVFGAWGGVQTAIANGNAAVYAEKLGAAWQGKNRPILALTSTQDTWRSSSEALVAALNAKKIPSTYRVIPGPHDQPWLKEAGMIEALLWFDRLSWASDKKP
jgi:pimeloyl-ACP methyl ester carboxylesterase